MDRIGAVSIDLHLWIDGHHILHGGETNLGQSSVFSLGNESLACSFAAVHMSAQEFLRAAPSPTSVLGGRFAIRTDRTMEPAATTPRGGLRFAPMTRWVTSCS